MTQSTLGLRKRKCTALAGNFPPFAGPLAAETDDILTASPSPSIMDRNPIIADRGEFVDALRLLRRGHVLVQMGQSSGGCVLDGGPIYHSYDPLHQYGLIDEFENPKGFKNIRYYRLSERGREFAERACEAWQRRPLWQRVAVRLAG